MNKQIENKHFELAGEQLAEILIQQVLAKRNKIDIETDYDKRKK